MLYCKVSYKVSYSIVRFHVRFHTPQDFICRPVHAVWMSDLKPGSLPQNSRPETSISRPQNSDLYLSQSDHKLTAGCPFFQAMLCVQRDFVAADCTGMTIVHYITHVFVAASPILDDVSQDIMRREEQCVVCMCLCGVARQCHEGLFDCAQRIP